MKKLLPIIFALMILLNACGTSAEPSPSPTQVVQESSSPIPEVNTIPTLGFSKETYIAAVDTYLKNQNYTTIASVAPTTPETQEAGITTYAYSMSPGFTLFLYEENASKNLTQIFIIADNDEISSPDMVGYGLTCFASIYQIDGDGADSIIAKLNMTSNSPDPINVASSAYCSYSYTIDETLTMFQILPA